MSKGRYRVSYSTAIIAIYQSYCENPCIRTAELLWKQILSNPEEVRVAHRQLYAIRRKLPLVDDDWKLTTSGSSGTPRRYPFGPLGSYWLGKIENQIKNPDYVQHILVYRMVGFPRWKPQIDLGSGIFSYRILGNCLDPDSMMEVLDTFPPHCVVSSSPSFFLTMLSYPQFCDWARSRNARFASSSTSGFFPSTYPVNNNMIDWSSGQNFWTCTSGQKHTLPLCVGGADEAYHLLNLCGTAHPLSDLMEYEEKTLCPCGKSQFPITFLPHVETAVRNYHQFVYDLSLADRLKGHYESFQLVQNGDGFVDILYIRDDYKFMDSHDMDVVENYLKNHQLSCGKFFKNHYFLTSASVDKTEAIVRNIFVRPYQKVVPWMSL